MSTSERLRILTWNVGRLYSLFGHNWLADADLPRVATLIRELSPDAVLLQELTGDAQLARLTSALDDVFHGATASTCSYDRKAAVLVRRDLGPVDIRQIRLEPSGRGVVGAAIVKGGLNIALASVHLEVGWRRIRRAQILELVAETDRWTDDLVLLGGDFNLDPAWAERIRSSVDVDAFAQLKARFVDVGAGIGPTLVGVWRVDHVLIRGPVREARAHVIQQRRLPLGDHDAVFCELALDRR
jgi:endonuclease/exonuclease/phosphatase family metal-dependent hydrolase